MAASITAGGGPGGTPGASSGTKAPEGAELFAVSGPATPSTAPWPNRSGCFERRRSSAYETKEEMMWAEPGMIPIRKPRTGPPRREGEEEGDDGARAGDDPDKKAEAGPPPEGRRRIPPLLARREKLSQP